MTPRPIRVKVCGITNVHDAELAAALGADAIGLVFCDSPRRVELGRARAIVRSLPPFVTAVGVFADASVDEVVKAAGEVGLGAVQLHGREEPGVVEAISRHVKVIKAFRVKGRETLAEVQAYPAASAFLFDAYVKGRMGGTGASFDWSLLAGAAEDPDAFPKPWILAGGLRPDNVEDAIRTCRPYAVDVSSGVEKEPGVKDPKKLEEFITKARQVLV